MNLSENIRDFQVLKPGDMMLASHGLLDKLRELPSANAPSLFGVEVRTVPWLKDDEFMFVPKSAIAYLPKEKP